MKNWIKIFIENLAKSNQETFGNKPMDCCSLNKKTSANNNQNKK